MTKLHVHRINYCMRTVVRESECGGEGEVGAYGWESVVCVHVHLCTVPVNKKFTFRFKRTIVLRCESFRSVTVFLLSFF